MESLIRAQDERWRDALHIQVEQNFLSWVANGCRTRESLP